MTGRTDLQPRLACLALSLALSCCVLTGETVKVYRLRTKAELIDAAAVHASRYPEPRRHHLRYIDLAAVAPKARPRALQALGYVLNSLSRNDLITLPLEVPGTEGALACLDLGDYHIEARAWDRLGELGSGPAPFPEPFYHLSTLVEVKERGAEKTEEYTEKVRKKTRDGHDYEVWDQRLGRYVPEYETVTRTRVVKGAAKAKGKAGRKVALGAHLNKATALGLVTLTGTEFPVYEYHWFLANALTEPRYHELLGLDDTEESAKKLAAVDEKTADRVGAQTRGAVLFSEVAHRNRILERTPTLQRYGRGSYQESYDYKTSVDLQDVLKDLLNDAPDAHEIIWNLPNGLLGFMVTDGQGKRLDKADGDVANNKRGRFRDSQVRTAFHCVACHLPERGWIEVDDEVRALSAQAVKLLADSFDEKGKERGKRIRQKYLGIDFNELLRSDQAVVEAAVKAATGGRAGLSCPETTKLVIDAIWDYLEQPVTLARLSAELGYSQEAVTLALQAEGTDPCFVSLRAGRKARRDQVEAGFSKLAALLYGKSE